MCLAPLGQQCLPPTSSDFWWVGGCTAAWAGGPGLSAVVSPPTGDAVGTLRVWSWGQTSLCPVPLTSLCQLSLSFAGPAAGLWQQPTAWRSRGGAGRGWVLGWGDCRGCAWWGGSLGSLTSAHPRVQAEEDVEEPQWHHPKHPGGDSLPRAHHLQEHPPPGAWLDQAHHHWQACPW